ncbi:hypothetical protein ABN298_16540, partial [Escherichia coli]|uniref:hypothetical protein n=1 Tax=Escherichia coli TaxID=562 RepID=UPI001C68D19E
DRNRSHWSTSKTPSYTKSVSWQHHPASNKKPDMQSQTNIHNVFLFTTINNSITIIEMNDGLYKEYTLPPHPDNMICTLPS